MRATEANLVTARNVRNAAAELVSALAILQGCPRTNKALIKQLEAEVQSAYAALEKAQGEFAVGSSGQLY